MKLIYMEPVLEEIEKQQDYYEQAEDYDCAEAVMSAKWAVINAKEVEAIPIEWLRDILQQAVDSGGRYEDVANGLGLVLAMWEEKQEAKNGID